MISQQYVVRLVRFLVQDLPFSVQIKLDFARGCLLNTDISQMLEKIRLSMFDNPTRIAIVFDHYLTGVHQLLISGTPFFDILLSAAEGLYWVVVQNSMALNSIATHPTYFHSNIYISLVISGSGQPQRMRRMGSRTRDTVERPPFRSE